MESLFQPVSTIGAAACGGAGYWLSDHRSLAAVAGIVVAGGGTGFSRGSEEALIFALACEAARERLVVSYARRATGESRPRLPSVFFRELASQLEGERVSADDAPLLAREDVLRIPGDAIGAPIRVGHAHDPQAVSVAAAGAVSEPERDRTYLQARVTRPLAVATFERAQPSFARALQAAHARFAERYSVWDGALGPEALAWAAMAVSIISSVIMVG